MKRVYAGLMALVTCGAAWAGGYPLTVEAVKEEEGLWGIVVHNGGTAPVNIAITLKNRKNVRIGGVASSGEKALEPGAKETVMLAIADVAGEPMSFEYETKWTFGRGVVRGEHTGLYRPPFAGDMTFDTNNSSGEEQVTPRTKHAIDIMMPVGTAVMAARAGWVMDYSGRAGGDEGDGVHPTYENGAGMGSYVRIIHEDGTWAEYLHLKPGSINVKVGQRIEAGSQIAESGESGSAKVPHLQFSVMKSGAGFGEPQSLPFRMEMFGRGVVTAKAGDPMGASFSVAAAPETTMSDPLVIAPVKAGTASSMQGVYSAGRGKELGAMSALLVLSGIGMTLLGGVAVVLIRERKKAESWREVADKLRFAVKSKKKLAEQGEERVDGAAGKEEASEERRMRPKKGYMVAEWERAFYDSVSIAMPLGYVAHPKVSLHSVLHRPLWIIDDAEALAMLKCESIDVAIVRERDSRIVCAIDLSRDAEACTTNEKVKAAKRSMLESAGIKLFEVGSEAGPSDLRALIDKVAPSESRGLDYGGKMTMAA